MNDASNSAEDNNFLGSRLENLLSGISMFCGWLLVVITVLQFGIVLARYLFAVNYLWLQGTRPLRSCRPVHAGVCLDLDAGPACAH